MWITYRLIITNCAKSKRIIRTITQNKIPANPIKPINPRIKVKSKQNYWKIKCKDKLTLKLQAIIFREYPLLYGVN
jgi:hypothetical protein